MVGFGVYQAVRHDFLSYVPGLPSSTNDEEMVANGSTEGAPSATSGNSPGASGQASTGVGSTNPQSMSQAQLEKLYGPPPAVSPAPAPTYSRTMPAAVTPVLDSIEQSGLKDNPNVTFDTSSIPSGTSVRFDRASWINISDRISSISGEVSALGQKRTGSLTFELVNSSWKATGYSIN